jgi:formylglycine-generating enzyme
MKTKLQFLFTGLTLLAVVHQANAQVTNLGIASVAGGQSLLYWPVSATNYVLQTTTNLASLNWVTASNAVTVIAVTVTNSAPAGYFRLVATTNAPAGMALIPGGSFTMGNYLFINNVTNDNDITDANPTNVTVTSFYMEVNEVSYSQWTNVYAYATNHGYNFVNAGFGKAGNHPVQSVDWFDCVKWSNARSQEAGLTPVYYKDAGFTQVFTNGDNGTVVYHNLAANGYRLPTEAEWEKASRGGLTGNRFPWGNTISGSQANYFGITNNFSYDLGPNGYNSIGSVGGISPATSPVGSFAPNGYGLFDMTGNVYEWCWDWYGTPYAQPTTNNPTGAAASNLRVARGGSWGNSAEHPRCAYRFGLEPYAIDTRIGFRCVRRL